MKYQLSVCLDFEPTKPIIYRGVGAPQSSLLDAQMLAFSVATIIVNDDNLADLQWQPNKELSDGEVQIAGVIYNLHTIAFVIRAFSDGQERGE